MSPSWPLSIAPHHWQGAGGDGDSEWRTSTCVCVCVSLLICVSHVWRLTGDCPSASACGEWDRRYEPLYLTFSLLSLSSPWSCSCWVGQFFLSPSLISSSSSVLLNVSCFQDGLSDRLNLRGREFVSIYLKTRAVSPWLLEQTIMVQDCVVEGKFLPDARQEVERKPLNNVILSWIPQGFNLLITFQLSWSNCFWKDHRYTQRCAPWIPCMVFDVIKVTELSLTGSWTFLCPGNGSGTLLCFRHYTIENLIPRGALCIAHCKKTLIAAPQIFGCL